MIQRLAVWAARMLPTRLKRWVHSHRTLDNTLRHLFGRTLSLGGRDAEIGGGPLKGMRLLVTEHVSHAHVSGAYELETQEAIARLVEPGDTCYDVGASIGYLTLLMARRGRQVIAFEPAPHAADQIDLQVQANRLANVRVVRAPVSDTVHTVSFALTDNAYGSAIAYGKSKWPTIELSTVTLDQFATTNPPPDFLKIDVEGEEARVIEGAVGLLQHTQPKIVVELHSAVAAAEVVDRLQRLGYRIATLAGCPFVPSSKVTAGEVQVIAWPLSRPTPPWLSVR